MLSQADHSRLVKLLGVLGSEHAGERDAAALAIERLRRSTGLTWAELLRPARARPRIIIPPWPVKVPILARGQVAGCQAMPARRFGLYAGDRITVRRADDGVDVRPGGTG
jgi:hypothetical protein